MSRRTQRVEDLFRIELSDLLLRKVSDPRARTASIARVDVSADLQRAVVWISVLGDEETRRQTVDALSGAAAYLRLQLARRLRHMRRVPELAFALDRGAEHQRRITDLLEGLTHDDADTSA